MSNHHYALGEVIEDGSFQREHLPSDDGVGQGEADEERLEGGEPGVGRHTKTSRGDTEGAGCPFGDGIRDRLLKTRRPAVSGHRARQGNSKSKQKFLYISRKALKK